MSVQDFWALVEQAGRQSADITQVPPRMVDALCPRTINEIVAYDLTHTAYMDQAFDRRLWAAAFVICGGCSDDCFVSFRGWLIAHGKKVYEEAISNPDSLSLVYEPSTDPTEAQLEPMGSVPFDAYYRKTGLLDFETICPPWTPPKVKNEDIWSGDQRKEALAEIVPRLVAKFM